MRFILILMISMTFSVAAVGQTETPLPPKYDAELAKKLGADEMGMRAYVLVILKTGPKKMPAGDERNAMFALAFCEYKALGSRR